MRAHAVHLGSADSAGAVDVMLGAGLGREGLGMIRPGRVKAIGCSLAICPAFAEITLRCARRPE